MLITKREEILPYEVLPSNFDVKKIAAFIEAAELKYIKPLLGKEEFEELTIAYQNSIKETNPSTLDQGYIDLLHWVRRPLVQFALGMGSSSISVSLTNHGITRTETGSNKSAYQYQELNWKRDKMLLGYEFWDDLEQFLEENLSKFGFYAESKEREERKSMFVSTSRILSEHVGLNIGGFIHFQLFRQFLRVEKKVERTIGANVFSSLKEQLLDLDQNSSHKEINLVREVVSNLGLAQAIPLLRLKVDAQGVTMINNEKTKSIEVHKPVKDDQAKDLIDSLNATGEAALLELTNLYAPDTPEEEDNMDTSVTSVNGGFIT